jgi:hypothetical protein
MVDVVFSNEELSIFGGPASIDVNVDYGPPGVRGSLIFSGPGKPTDAAVMFPTEPRPQDLYINLLPSDLNNEYLFLYQYGIINGVASWSKVLRLIPNTAIANIPVVFIDGAARTIVPSPEGLARINSLLQQNTGASLQTILEDILLGSVPQANIGTTPPDDDEPTAQTRWIDASAPNSPRSAWPLKKWDFDEQVWVIADETTQLTDFWLDLLDSPIASLKRWTGSAWEPIASIDTGLFFPISDFFVAEEIQIGRAGGFNVQYVLLSDSPVSSGLKTEPLTEIGSKIYLPVKIQAVETEPLVFGQEVSWKKINGIRVLSFVVVANIGTLPLI